MDRTANRSPTRERPPQDSSTTSNEGRAASIPSNDNRSGDAPDSSPDHSIIEHDDLEEDFNKTENQRNNVIWKNSRVSPNENQLWDVRIDQVPKHKSFSRANPHRNSKTNRIADIFEAILNEIENLSPQKERQAESPKKKTLREIIESDQSLVPADYSVPPSMITKEAIGVLQALIDRKRKPQKGLQKGRKWRRTSMEWSGLRQPLNYQAEIVREPHNNITAR